MDATRKQYRDKGLCSRCGCEMRYHTPFKTCKSCRLKKKKWMWIKLCQK